MSFRSRSLVAIVLALVVCLATQASPSSARRLDLPPRLSDQDFWQLVTDLSEPNGFFNSDNLVSNEDHYQDVIPELVGLVKPGGVYVGVGPDQNFTYIAALEPRMAFIPDVRRGNLLVQLMYKALFDLSADRIEFASRLFSRARPPLDAGASIDEIMTALALAPANRDVYERNLRAIVDQLTKTHGFLLSQEDLDGIDFAYSSFFAAGPRLAFVSNGGYGRQRYPTFWELQTKTDVSGVNHSYLASDRAYRAVKLMEERNLIVPVVGNFAGPRALRRIGVYLREHGATVTAFYTSNVEQYLFQDRIWDDFRANVAAMPFDETSTFIRSCFNSCSVPGGSRAVTLLDSIPALLGDASAGRVQSYWDVLNHSRRP
jgi:hypothetical protein